MYPINSAVLRGAGKNTKFVTCNSSFMDLAVGHLADINYCVETLVKPNEYQGIVLGIGYPEPPEFFPNTMDEKRICEEEKPIFESIRNRLQKMEKFKTYFERMYMLKMALRGEIPYKNNKKKILKKLEIKTIPTELVFILPKYSHTVYPWLYDMVYRRDYQGYLEPEKDDIQTQFIFISEARQKDRVKEKDAQRRNIHVTAAYDYTIPELMRRYRKERLLTSEEENSILTTLKNKEFELYISPFEFLDSTQMRLIDETLNNAIKKNREAVFVVPFTEVPKEIEKNYEFWRKIRAAGSMSSSKLSPFARYVDLKKYIDELFRVTKKEERDKVHITFMEMEEDGSVPNPQKNSSYIPKNIAGLHGYEKLVSNLKQILRTQNSRNNTYRATA